MGSNEQSYAQLQKMYGADEFYWGTDPNAFARRALGFMPEPADGVAPRAVDIGAGEGRDAVFLAERGLDVLAVDVSPNGLRKAERLARERGTGLRSGTGGR